jgi:hypothetical protein
MRMSTIGFALLAAMLLPLSSALAESSSGGTAQEESSTGGSADQSSTSGCTEEHRAAGHCE